MECYKEIGNVINTFDELFKLVKSYIQDPEQLKVIQRAYLIADEMHENQVRKSGEPYILHPLNVAYIAAEYKLDYETICAALLHDVVEDTAMSLEELSKIFGERIAILVDGVTKITNMQFSSKNEEERANENKILHSMCHDIRILFIKMADRLHNMRTMSSMPEKKQKQKSIETYELYVPLAYRFGLYRIKEELDDIALFYRDRSSYEKVYEMIKAREEEYYELLGEMKGNINTKLLSNGIDATIEESIKNIASVYTRIKVENNLENVHDLLSLKVIVPEISDCYSSLGIIHSLYPHIDSRFKDYMYTPKTNNYRSLHTVLFGKQLTLVQARIRTYEMEQYARCGIITYLQGKSSIDDSEIRKKLVSEFSTFRELVEAFSNDENIDARKIINEQLKPKINIYTSLGKKIEMPLGSTILDAAFCLGGDFVTHYDGAFVNNQPVNINYKLNDGDIIKIIRNYNTSAPRKNWARQVKTELAREKIKSIFQKS